MNNVYDGVGIIRIDIAKETKEFRSVDGSVRVYKDNDNHLCFCDYMSKFKGLIIPVDFKKMLNALNK